MASRSWNDLPPELIVSVLPRLPWMSRLRAAATCSAWELAHTTLPRPTYSQAGLVLATPPSPALAQAAHTFPMGVVWSPCGEFVASTFVNYDIVCVWRATTGELMWEIYPEYPLKLAFVRDDALMVACATCVDDDPSESEFVLFRVSTGEVMSRHKLEETIYECCLGNGGKTAYVRMPYEPSSGIYICTHEGVVERNVLLPSSDNNQDEITVFNMLMSPNEQTLLTVSDICEAGTMHFLIAWDVQTGRRLRRWRVGCWNNSSSIPLAWAPSGGRFAAACPVRPTTVTIYDLMSHSSRRIELFPKTNHVTNLFWTTSRLVIARKDGSVQLWDVAPPGSNGDVQRRVIAPAPARKVAAVSPDGRAMVVVIDDNDMRVESLV